MSICTTDASVWLEFLGRLHPMVLHLPIGLWIGVAVLEYGGAMFRRTPQRSVIATLAWLAAVTSIMSAGTGWVLSQEPHYSPTTDLELHRWLGIAVAVVGLLAAIFSGLQARQGFRVLLMFVLLVIGPAGHFGSVITHGQGWLFEPFQTREPATPNNNQQDPNNPNSTATDKQGWVAVQAMLINRCGKCHGETKQKAELALHTREGIEKGAEIGPVLVPGKPEDSLIFTTLELPLDDDYHMPPEGKPQPTKEEIEMLRAWIAAGAPWGDGEAAAVGDAKEAPKEAPKEDPKETPKEQPKDGGDDSAPEQTGSEGQDNDDQAQAAAPVDPAEQAAIAALKDRHAHVAQVAPDADGLWVDFAAIAPTVEEAEVTALLTPLVDDIVDLSVARAPISDETLVLCSQMPNLERLDVRKTKITDEGVAHLRNSKKLRELVLAQNQLGQGTVASLLEMPGLTKVYLWNSGITEEGIAKLRTASGLEVDTGEAPVAKPLETEDKPKFSDELPPPGQEAQPAEVLAALKSVNKSCPVSGKPVDSRFVVVHAQRAVGFCCPNCPKAFWANPSKYPVASDNQAETAPNDR